ncbi:hypothetical protein TKWG_07180 [Advenella kashmirensis WT001]|uniref:Barstar (barnase inhibitor) domain-containing protein n=1 Tax=Advenella kashmirensis (strain DSM 17095 / LMG 22695 / WT001) TaxID=1036672 RepID=I3UA29_ADVKW|nr:barstar family protein [Advenella kashmirensis]AFK61867.1 hypothetical protein TKWG_07180 [Advenella kashmirensis WT001]
MNKKTVTPLKAVLETGGAIKEKSIGLDELKAHAEKAGLAYFEADCDKARSCSAVLRAIAKAVDYPVFFGSNMDALLDCLGETLLEQKGGMVLALRRLHSEDDSLLEHIDALKGVLNDTVEYGDDNGRVFSYLVEHAGKHEAPEPGRAPRPYAQSD